MKDTIMIDGFPCEVIPTDYEYKKLILVRKDNLTGCWHRHKKKLVDGWHEQINVKYSNIPLSGRKPW